MTASVEKWTNYVAGKVPSILLPVALGVIQKESGGIAGKQAGATTRFGIELPSSGGGTVYADRALGLMQVIPIVIREYNDGRARTVTYEEMTGTSTADGHKQLDIGIWAYFNNVILVELLTGKNLIQGSRLNTDLLKLVLVSYNWGFGNLRKKIDVLTNQGLDPNFDNLAQMFPALGEPANSPLKYVSRVLNYARGYADMDPSGIYDTIDVQPIAGAGLALLITGALAWWVLRRK
jgi:hypothetical protein